MDILKKLIQVRKHLEEARRIIENRTPGQRSQAEAELDEAERCLWHIAEDVHWQRKKASRPAEE